jgi:hypothetical protein
MIRQSPEHRLQCELIKWLAANGRPELQWFAVANGELRHPRVAMRLKAEGVKPGVADLCFLLPDGRTGWLELKARRGQLSDEQRGFAATALRLGHHWGRAKTLEEAAQVLRAWGVLRSLV